MTPWLLQILAHLVVDHLRFILRANASEILALGLGNAQLLKGVFDIFRQIVPGCAGLLRRLDVVVDVVEGRWC